MTGREMTPSASEVEALRDQVDPGPVVILNLLKYREPGGSEAFGTYGALSGPLVARQGGELFYMGEAGPTIAGEEWDTIVMIRFPSIDAFIGLAADSEYQKTVIRDRHTSAYFIVGRYRVCRCGDDIYGDASDAASNEMTNASRIASTTDDPNASRRDAIACEEVVEVEALEIRQFEQERK